MENNYVKDEYYRIKRRCLFCKERSNVLNRVYRVTFDTYGRSIDSNYRFHFPCLKEVLCNPEEYGTENVDTALKITEIISRYKAEKERTREYADTRRNKLVAEALKKCHIIDEYI